MHSGTAITQSVFALFVALALSTAACTEECPNGDNSNSLYCHNDTSSAVEETTDCSVGAADACVAGWTCEPPADSECSGNGCPGLCACAGSAGDCHDDLDNNCDGLVDNAAECACGDDVVGTGEECEPGVDAFCDQNCTFLICGNGQPDTGETCDPGSDPDCRDNCTKCGDGVVDAALEECDDQAGNGIDAVCNAQCQFNVCGDGVVSAGLGETCEPSSNQDCRADCTSCGDGVVDIAAGETCDDGLPAANSACTATCQTCGCPGCC